VQPQPADRPAQRSQEDRLVTEPLRRLPIRLAPAHNEVLTSYIGRLAAVHGRPPSCGTTSASRIGPAGGLVSGTGYRATPASAHGGPARPEAVFAAVVAATGICLDPRFSAASPHLWQRWEDRLDQLIPAPAPASRRPTPADLHEANRNHHDQVPRDQRT
jgi:hypothetical protein